MGSSYHDVFLNMHVIGKLNEQSQQGIQQANSGLAFLKTVSSLQDKYVEGMTKALHAYPVAGEDILMQLRGSIALDIEHTSQHSKLLSQSICPAIQSFLVTSEVHKAKLAEEDKVVGGQLTTMALKAQKYRHNCHTLLDSLTEKEIKMKQNSNNSSNNKNNVLTKTKNMFKGKDKEKDKAVEQASKLRNVVRAANQKANTELPALLESYRQLEIGRLDMLQEQMAAFVAAKCRQVVTAREAQEVREKKLSVYNSEDFVDSLMEQCAEEVKMEANNTDDCLFVYDLDVTPEQIAAGQFKSDKSMFGKTLTEVIAAQKDKYPREILPMILMSLVLSLRKHPDFLQTEGIFRVSVSKLQLEALRSQYEKGQFGVPAGCEPHLPACLLKDWLRSLAEPLIPALYYDRAIACVSNNQRDTDEEAIEAVKGVFDDCPDLNKMVVEVLADLVGDISAPENIIYTKMTVKNLAVVFAPSLLRCPSLDPLIIMKNAKFEMQFCTMLFTALTEFAQEDSMIIVDSRRCSLAADSFTGGVETERGGGGGGGAMTRKSLSIAGRLNSFMAPTSFNNATARTVTAVTAASRIISPVLPSSSASSPVPSSRSPTTTPTPPPPPITTSQNLAPPTNMWAELGRTLRSISMSHHVLVPRSGSSGGDGGDRISPHPSSSADYLQALSRMGSLGGLDSDEDEDEKEEEEGQDDDANGIEEDDDAAVGEDDEEAEDDLDIGGYTNPFLAAISPPVPSISSLPSLPSLPAFPFLPSQPSKTSSQPSTQTRLPAQQKRSQQSVLAASWEQLLDGDIGTAEEEDEDNDNDNYDDDDDDDDDYIGVSVQTKQRTSVSRLRESERKQLVMTLQGNDAFLKRVSAPSISITLPPPLATLQLSSSPSPILDSSSTSSSPFSSHSPSSQAGVYNISILEPPPPAPADFPVYDMNSSQRKNSKQNSNGLLSKDKNIFFAAAGNGNTKIMERSPASTSSSKHCAGDVESEVSGGAGLFGVRLKGSGRKMTVTKH